jgi:hypothetical protein
MVELQVPDFSCFYISVSGVTPGTFKLSGYDQKVDKLVVFNLYSIETLVPCICIKIGSL